MPVPNTFATATSAIPLAQLDQNFGTAITIGNTAVQLGNTVTTLNNMTLANVTVSTTATPIAAGQGGTGLSSPGTSGNYLVSNGTAWVSQAGPSGIQRGTEQATTSGTAIDFTGIPAGVRRITVMFDSVSFTGADGATIQLGSSGGIETTGYTGNIGIVTGTSTGTGGSWAANGIKVIYDGTAAADNCSGIIHLVNQTGNKWNAMGIITRNGNIQIYNTQGWKTLSNTLDRIRFKVDGGSSFDAGAINIMWEF